MPFKLAVIKEVQSGEIGINAAMRKYGIQGRDTIRTWIRKYSIFDDDNTSKLNSMKTPQQRIKELEQQVRRLKHEKEFLEGKLTETEDKAAILDKVIELAEKEYLIPIRKNSLPDQSKKLAKKGKNQ